MTNEVYASGAGWIGGGVGSVETALHKLFTGARFRIVMTAYSVTGSWELLPTWIRTATDRGVEVLAIVNRLQTQPACTQLAELSYERPSSFALFDFSGPEGIDLHAKVMVADEEHALVGSSNFSARGLVHNYELGVLVNGDAARKAADLVRRLSASPYAVRWTAST